jgi:hypothetical protein
MTRILAVNYAHSHSSIVSTCDSRIVEGRVLADPAFPRSSIREIKDPYNDWDYAVCHISSQFDDFKTQIKSISAARTVLVDYREALAMSSISLSDWTSCAVMIVDSGYCGLGYYAQNQFHWIREFWYPNSISLFYSAAARFLGFDPLIDEHKLIAASQYGNPIYAPLIEQKFVHCEPGDYTILQNLTRGIGCGPLNLDIASSVQTVFDKVVLSLATWLANAVDSKRLAYAGRSSSNYLTNTKIVNFSGFNEILIQPLTSYAGAVVGAASLIKRSIFSTTAIGETISLDISPDTFATQLLRGKIMPLINGRAEFADTSLINRNLIALPFATVIPEFRQRAKLTEPWQQPIVLCKEQDYATYYTGRINPTYGQYISHNKPNSLVLGTDKTRVVTTSISSNAYINRVLDVLRVEGYPFLLSSPII